jgi:hypothetical protein
MPQLKYFGDNSHKQTRLDTGPYNQSLTPTQTK